MESRAFHPRSIWRARIALPLVLLIHCSSTALTHAADDADMPKRGDEFLLFRETKVELPSGDSRTFDRGTRGRVIQVEGTNVVAMVERAKVTVPLDNTVAGRSGVARLSVAIRERPEDWLNYILRGRLRRELKDYDAAIKDLKMVPETDREYPTALAYIGFCYGDQGNWQAAVDSFTQSIELYRPFGSHRSIATMLAYRGAAYYHLDKLDEASDDLHEAIELGYDNDLDVYRWLARVLVKQEKQPDAVEILKKAKDIDPEDENVRWASFEIYNGLDLYDLALAEVNAVLERKPDDLEALAARAAIYIDQKRLVEALADTDRALAIKSDHPDALICKALILYDKGDPEQLKVLCEKIAKFELDGVKRLYLRAYVLAAAGMDTEAFADVNKVLQADGNNARALVLRAGLYSDRDEWNRVLADAEAAVRIAPQQAEAFYFRALGHAGTGKLDAALADLNRAVLLNATYCDAYVGRADVLHKLGRREAALADVRTALGMNPDDEEIALKFTKHLALNERIDEALVHLTDCIHRFEDNSGYYSLRAAVWNKKREYRMAIADLTEALLLSPDDTESLTKRAISYLAINQLENASDDLKAAESHGPLNPEGQYALATLRELRGEYAAAIKQYERLLAIDGVKAYGHGRLARVFATAADADFRDGKRAMEHAQAVCELSKFQAAMPLSYLAAAHAENGDFAAAVRWQTKAVALADDFDRKELTAQLELYKAGKPYRQTPVARVAARPK